MTLTICPRCGQYNRDDETRCLFCGALLVEHGERLLVRPCIRCGQMLPVQVAVCPRCNAVQPATVLSTTSEPVKIGCLARGGYVLAAMLGALLALIGVILGGIFLLDEFDVDIGTLALTALILGVALLWHAVYALNEPAGLNVTLWPSGVWNGLLIAIWVPGSLAIWIAPQAIRPLLPLLIVFAALLPSFSFVSTAVYGLRKPAARPPFRGKLGPRYLVYLTALLSAIFSTFLAIMAEVVAAAVIAGAMIAAAYAVGDVTTYELLIDIANDPDLDRLEDLIGVSPIIFAGLFANLAVSTPLIEEATKGLVVLLVAWRSRLSERMMILLGAAAGMGFSFVENVGYLSLEPTDWPLMVIFRACGAAMHGVSTGLVGRGLYRALRKGVWHKALLDFATAVGIHGGWNLLALIIVWFGYKGMAEGVLFVIAVGLFPLAILFSLLARWGIWVSESFPAS